MKKNHLPTALALGIMATLTMYGCNQPRSDSASSNEKPATQTTTVDGVTFYYGVVKGNTVKEHSTAHTEANMHKGPPASTASYHIVLALFETTSNQRITDATVEVRLGPSSTPAYAWLQMEAMRDVGSESFGRYVELPNPGQYPVEFRVNKDGRTNLITARFTFERPE